MTKSLLIHRVSNLIQIFYILNKLSVFVDPTFLKIHFVNLSYTHSCSPPRDTTSEFNSPPTRGEVYLFVFRVV